MFVAESWLNLAHTYAVNNSGCTKVKVGAVIVKNDKVLGIGANKAIPDICKHRGCLRTEKYGENTKTHRNPDDCRAIHSEIDALCNSHGSLAGAVMFVTRYPCEACARAIVAAGISVVYYGREQEISDMTREIFDNAEVDCYNIFWKEEDTTL